MTWTSRYGSVVAAGFDAGTADGMNEKGLVANLLYLTESEYVTPSDKDPRKTLSISLWAQYALDNFATVAERSPLSKDEFYVVTTLTPDGKPGQLHSLLGCERRFRHLPVRGGQAADLPRPQLSGDDQLADL
jgi:choloylglycine hydrolase